MENAAAITELIKHRCNSDTLFEGSLNTQRNELIAIQRQRSVTVSSG